MMRDRLRLVNNLIIALLLSSDLTIACQDMKISQVTTTHVELEVTRKVTQVCQYAIAINKGSYNNGSYNRYLRISGSSHIIPFQFWNDNLTQIIKDLPDTTPPNATIYNTFELLDPTKRSEKIRYVRDNVDLNVKAGTYSNTFTIKLYTRNINGTNQWSQQRSRSHNVSYVNPPAIETCLVEPGGPFQPGDNFQSIDFGRVSTNKEVAFDMLVKNNKSFRFTMSSLNSGYMVQSGSGNNLQKKIKYKIVLSATSFNPKTEIISFPYTSNTISPSIGSENRFPLKVQVTDTINNKQAGSYSDQVTINYIAL